MYRLNQNLLRSLTDYMFVEDQPRNADVTLVLGMTLWQRPLQQAITLHKSGLAGTLIFSGGMNSRLGMPESIAMKNGWIAYGLSPGQLLIDDQSTNTYENMIHCKQLLQTRGLFRQGLTVNLIAISYHMRRAIETFTVVFGPGFNLGIVNYPSIYCHQDSWFADPRGQQLILGEAMKIFNYLPESVLPQEIRKALMQDHRPEKV